MKIFKKAIGVLIIWLATAAAFSGLDDMGFILALAIFPTVIFGFYIGWKAASWISA